MKSNRRVMAILMLLGIMPTTVFASESILMADSLVRIGGEPVPALLKESETGCMLAGLISATEIHRSTIIISKKVCITPEGQSIEEGVNMKTQVASAVSKNTATGEIVNRVDAGTVVTF